MASRRGPKPSGGDEADEVAAPGQDFLDESEQVQVVEELRRQQREHARNYRVCAHIYLRVHVALDAYTHGRSTHRFIYI